MELNLVQLSVDNPASQSIKSPTLDGEKAHSGKTVIDGVSTATVKSDSIQIVDGKGTQSTMASIPPAANIDDVELPGHTGLPELKRYDRWNGVLLVGLWFGLGLGLTALIALVLLSVSNAEAGMLILACFGLLASLGLMVFALRTVPRKDVGLAGVDRVGNPDEGFGAELMLAGTESLTALQLAEKVLDSDVDARLVARRDGVVVFANRQYQRLAREAGVEGFSGLPPRIERLFAQQGAEAMKIFRLCRAARSGDTAHEEIYQVSPVLDGARRRFFVSVQPIKGDDIHATWSLRELPVEEEAHDPLASAYADYLRPVFALEKSGQIMWANAMMRERLGAEKGTLHHIDDVVLGETAELVKSISEDFENTPIAKIRRTHEGPIDGTFQGFARGGTGDGFVCVELTLEDEELEQEELTLSGDVNEAPFGVAVVEGEFGKDARILEANKAFSEVFGGAARNAAVAKHFSADTLEGLAREVKRKGGAASQGNIIEERIGEGPSARVFALYVKPVSRRRGGYGTRRTLIYSVEITERKRMEIDHGQDQKLKAIGNLAGEVAHDFNNFLQTILGNCELLLMNHPVGDPSNEQLLVIRENSQRLANLTKQLLAFSRKQTMKRTKLSLTDLLRDFTKFLDRAVGDKVQLDLINGRGLQSIKVDQNQLEAAIMNLAVNARDAMGASGGKLTIRTQHISAEDIEQGAYSDLAPQDHVLLEISDTGPGVPEDIADKIFDPFFTTKDVGKGTGLGLSTVYGVIGQMGGAIYLDSKPGEGATFRIFLPAYHEVPGESEADEVKAPQVEVADLTGMGRILVVEDEDSVRNFVKIALIGRGYDVMEACDGTEALDVLEEQGPDYFDLIISDVMMTEMDGPVFVQKTQERYGMRPRVIFISGYAEAAMRDQIDESEDTGYLQKPFQAEALAQAVKGMIGTPAN